MDRPAADSVVLVASKAGADHHPAWFHNLKAHPDVEVEIDGVRHPMRAREVLDPERAALWDLVNDNYPGYATYQQRATGRRIPVLLLEPR